MKRILKVQTSRLTQATSIHFSIHEVVEKHLPSLINRVGKRCVIITDSQVKKKYGKVIEHLDAKIFSFPAGEISKTRETKAMLEDLLLTHHFGRDSRIIALGGGVVCDLVGFLASTYCRGTSLILVPTTLLAMVDAAIGGKTGVNTSHGKNMIGTFYAPEQVLIDTVFLQTLPPEQMRNGLAEIIKYGLIASENLFEELQQKRLHFESADMSFMMKIIQESISIKMKILKEDPFEEKTKRRILNYGHTIGHAIEKLEDYTLPHGQAVAIGMIVSAFISYEMDFLPFQELEKIEQICKEYKIGLTLSKSHNFDDFLSTIALDKKALRGKPRFILLKNIGEPHPFAGEYCTEIPLEVLEKAFIWMNNRFVSSSVHSTQENAKMTS